MKRRDLLVGGSAALALSACAPVTTVVVAPPPPDLEPFYDPLSPYGDWWWNEHWGWVWSPTVGPGWRPYTRGTWVWTAEYGWLWRSSEPFGWATFHYGRWLWLDDAGWVWVPGRVWGPGWVVWRRGPGVVGWAPLHPDVVWVPGRGYIVVDLEVGLFPGAWVFVDEGHVIAPDIWLVCYPPPRSVVVWSSTTVIHHHHEHDHDGPRNRDVDVVSVGRAGGVSVPTHRVIHRDLDEHGAGDDAPDVVVVPRPRAVPRPRDDEPDLFGPRARLDHEVEQRPLPAPDGAEVDRHWNDVRSRLQETHEVERRTPPAGLRPEDLDRRQAAERAALERQKEKEKEAAKKKKETPRKVTTKRTSKKRNPSPKP